MITLESRLEPADIKLLKALHISLGREEETGIPTIDRHVEMAEAASLRAEVYGGLWDAVQRNLPLLIATFAVGAVLWWVTSE